MFLKTYNTEFDKIIIILMDQNGRPLEMEDKVNLTLLINKQKRRWYSIEPRAGKYVKGYGFLSFARKYEIQLLDTRLDALKTASKKVFHKAAEATDEVLGKKNSWQKCKTWWKSKKFWRNSYSTRKNRRRIKWTETSTIKIENYKISKLLNDSTASEFMTKNGSNKGFIKWSMYYQQKYKV